MDNKETTTALTDVDQDNPCRLDGKNDQALIATVTEEPQDSTHYLITEQDLRGNQPNKLEKVLSGETIALQFAYLGGTTYKYSVWAVRTHVGTIELWHVPYDFTGRWVTANKRTWNIRQNRMMKEVNQATDNLFTS